MDIVILERSDRTLVTLKKHSSIEDMCSPGGGTIRVIVDTWYPEDDSPRPEGLGNFDFDQYSVGEEIKTETETYRIVDGE